MRLKEIKMVDLADRLETTVQNVSKILNKNDMKVSTLERISDALNVPASFFLEKNKPDKEIDDLRTQMKAIQSKLDGFRA